MFYIFYYFIFMVNVIYYEYSIISLNNYKLYKDTTVNICIMRICVTGGNGMIGKCLKDISSIFPNMNLFFTQKW